MARKLLLRSCLVGLSLLCCVVTETNADDTRIETTLADGGKATILFADYPLKTMTEIPFAIVVI